MVDTAARPNRLIACLLLVSATWLLPLSCGQRERANPLDPMNPETGGSPPGFAAIALDAKVELRWTPFELVGLRGFNAYRREHSERQGASFELLEGSPFPSRLGKTLDSAVVNHTTYDYRLVPVIADYGEGTPTEIVPATPGPYFAVATDGWSGLIRKLSADMRASIWTAGGFYYPFSVASDGQNLWATDLYAGLLHFSGDGRFLWNAGAFLLPVWVSAHPGGTSAVADRVLGTVSVFSPQGRLEVTIADSLQGPTCVDFGPLGELWVADPLAGLVNKYSAEGSLVASFAGCTEPRFLDVDDADGTCWVSDVATAQVVKLSADAEEIVRTALFSAVQAVKVDDYAGGCWVADPARELVGRVSSEGKIAFSIEGVGDVVDIYVSRQEGNVWVADRKNGRLLAFTQGGKLLSSTTSVADPTSLTVLMGNP